MLERLYESSDHERLPFGDKWCGPPVMPRHESVLVAKYEAASRDGQTAEVYCSAFPARFYKIKVLASENSMKQPQPAWELRTGSDMEELAASIAKAVSMGMLGIGQPVDVAL